MPAPITAWGLSGAGIRAYDYMDGVQNKYGVKTVILDVDGEEVFRSTICLLYTSLPVHQADAESE